MKKVAILLFFMVSMGAFAQEVTKKDLENKINPLNYQLQVLQTENTKLKDELKSLQKALTTASEKLDNLQKQSDANRV